jgi:hypothetical protein
MRKNYKHSDATKKKIREARAKQIITQEHERNLQISTRYFEYPNYF